MKKTYREHRYGASRIDVMQIVFIILKLCKLIDWSWWVVLSPAWISLGISTILYAILKIVHMAERNKQQNWKQE